MLDVVDVVVDVVDVVFVGEKLTLALVCHSDRRSSWYLVLGRLREEAKEAAGAARLGLYEWEWEGVRGSKLRIQDDSRLFNACSALSVCGSCLAWPALTALLLDARNEIR